MELKEFVESVKGKYIDKKGKSCTAVQYVEPFGGQCVSLVFYYLKTFGKQHYTADRYGDAKDYTRLVYSTEVHKNDAKDGDLVVYPALGQYGHIGIFYQGKILSQNPHKVQLNSLSDFHGEYKFIRPLLDKRIDYKYVKGRYETLQPTRVRKQPGLKGDILFVKDLTVDGKKYATSNDPKVPAVYKRHTRYDVSEIKEADGLTWGKSPSGWVCLNYSKKL